MSDTESRLGLGDRPSDLVPVIVTSQNTKKSRKNPPENNMPASGLLHPNAKLEPLAGPVHSSNHPSDGKQRDREVLPPLASTTDLMLDAPAWLFSAAIHMLVVIILGLLFIAPERREDLLLRFDTYDSPSDDLLGTALDLSLEMNSPQVDETLSPQQLPTITQPLSFSETTLETPLVDRPLTDPSDTISLALTGREKGMQQALLDAYGGTAATQRSVMEGLRWLARNQGKRGMWSMQGPYSDGVGRENQEAATAMALIAFQGAGYTHVGARGEPFSEVVARGWRSLLKSQDEEGNFFKSGQSSAQLYTQALCTIALCELYGMTKDEAYREPAQRAIDYCVRVQAPQGGWKYFPRTGSDLSVTGWFVMALQSARMAGLEVPSESLLNVSKFLDSVSHNYGSHYAYQPNDAATKSMTAEGLLCRQYLGWRHSDERLIRGADYLIENLPKWENTPSGDQRNVYYWYYATQVCHHMEGHHWRTWNNVMREVLPENQVQGGKERGSWDPQGDRWGNAGGRLYVTCLSIYMLEVYYRHLPIYQVELFGGKF